MAERETAEANAGPADKKADKCYFILQPQPLLSWKYKFTTFTFANEELFSAIASFQSEKLNRNEISFCPKHRQELLLQ